MNPGCIIVASVDLRHKDCMDIAAFRESLKAVSPPAGLSAALEGLWWDAKGDWAKAHEAAQQDEGPDGSWVHAYLHRKEGDLSNAKYWYRRADRAAAYGDFEKEWAAIVTALLRNSSQSPEASGEAGSSSEYPG
jgi:hypothetical protein